MAKLFNTALLDEDLMKSLSSDEASWIYNGLDCCVTAEIYTTLTEQLEEEVPEVQATYDFALKKSAPLFQMALQGVLIDEYARQKVLSEFETKLNELNRKFQLLCQGVFGTEINWRSPTQLKTLFYGSLGLKEIKKRNANGVYAATTNEEALEKLKAYIHARPFCTFILAMRALQKSIGFLKTEIDPDGRIRTSYNIAGTSTGRLNSRMSDFGTGTNLQNVDRGLRQPFIPDPGMYFLNIDLEQADARNVGARIWSTFIDMPLKEILTYVPREYQRSAERLYEQGPEFFAGGYLDACESGDLHTRVCSMAWTSLSWPDDESEWKSFCDGLIAHGQDSYRQLAKKLGHGTNYIGKPKTMAQHTHTPSHVIEEFQRKYFNAFPGIIAWQNWVIAELKRSSTLYNLFGRRRIFFGRPDDAATHRAAIAYDPQSSTGEEIDRGLYQVWDRFEFERVQPLTQVHDSILYQIPFLKVADTIEEILKVMKVEIELPHGRKFSVPLEAKTGWNWGDYNYKKPQENPQGLKAWTGTEERNPPAPRKRFKDLVK